jgi:signal transduction histidine kinase
MSSQNQGSWAPDRVLILAPWGRDAALLAQVLGRAGILTETCSDAGAFAVNLATDAGAAMLTEEALSTRTLEHLRSALQVQPPWSNLPVILLLDAARRRRGPLSAEALVHWLDPCWRIIVLERPLPVATVVSVVQAALAARRQQYQVRDLLAQLKAINQDLDRRVTERTAVARQQAEQLRMLAGELVLAEEQERRRLAELLHDDLQQMLVAAQFQLKLLGRTEIVTEQGKTLEELGRLLGRSADAARSLTLELSPPSLHQEGLGAALVQLAAQFHQQHRLKVTVEADAAAEPETAQLRVFLFRAVRELLLNAVKHASGSAVDLSLARVAEETVRLVVADKGPGFCPSALAARHAGVGGFGLANLRDRVAALGGELLIDSAPGRGARLTLLTPIRISKQKSPSST